MTTEELVVAIRVTAENSEAIVGAVREEVEKLGGSVDDVKVKGADAFKPMTEGAQAAAAAQAALAAAATAALAKIIGAVNSGTQAYNAYTSAVKGLDSVAGGKGIGQEEMQQALEGVTDAFLSSTAAATAYKNLLSRGYTLDQATTTINRLKDAAAFGRQASLSLEDAVVSATEGLKNENSVLVDNAGVTKNVAKMWEEYAASIGVSASSLTQAQKVEAEYQGILAETALQVGDLQKASETLAGAQAEQAAQGTKLATAYGSAMTPAMQVATEVSTKFLAEATDLVETFPELISGATSTAAAFTAMLAAMKGAQAIKSLGSALSLASGTLAPMAAIAAVVGVATAAYSAYQNAQEEAAQAEREAAEEKERVRKQELQSLQTVNKELRTLQTQYADSQGSMGNLADAYDSGNDAIIDRIMLLKQEQTALLEKQKTETEAALAQKQAEQARLIEEAKVFSQGLAKEQDLFEFTGADEGYMHSYGQWDTSAWQQGVENWIASMESGLPEATSLVYELRDALYNADSLEAAHEAYDGFFDGLHQGIVEAGGEAASLEKLLAGIIEAIADPDELDFDKLFGGIDGAQEGVDNLGDSAETTQEEIESLCKEAERLDKELRDTAALKKKVDQYKELTQRVKETGGAWEDLDQDVQDFGRQLGVADGDIDALMLALDGLGLTLDSTLEGGEAEMRAVLSQLEAMRASILAIPEGELTVENSQALASINAAIALMNVFLHLLGQAGMETAGSTKSSGGGGSGGSKKTAAAAEDPAQKAMEAYREELEMIEHKRHMNQISAQEEIAQLQKLKSKYKDYAEAVMDLDERIYDARAQLREEEEDKITSVYDSMVDALEARYEEQREIEQKRIEESIAAWEKWSEETCAAIQAQIDALDEQEQAEEREEKRAEQLRKIAKLESALEYETDDYNKSQLLRQIEQAKAEWEKIQADWAREDQRQALEDEMAAVEKKAEEEIGKLEEESGRIDSVYDQLTDSASLAAEAQKMIMQSSQTGILDLLASYAPDYEATGRSLGEKLYEGFAAAMGDITAYFESLDRQFEAMVERTQQAAFGAAQSSVQSGETTANVSSPTINQTVNFNQPVESPADVAQRMQQVSESLAAMI